MPRSPAALINGVLDLFPTDIAHTGIRTDIIAVGASLGTNCAGGGDSLHPLPHSRPRSCPHTHPRSYPHTRPRSCPHTHPQSCPHTCPWSCPHTCPPMGYVLWNGIKPLSYLLHLIIVWSCGHYYKVQG